MKTIKVILIVSGAIIFCNGIFSGCNNKINHFGKNMFGETVQLIHRTNGMYVKVEESVPDNVTHSTSIGEISETKYKSVYYYYEVSTNIPNLNKQINILEVTPYRGRVDSMCSYHFYTTATLLGKVKGTHGCTGDYICRTPDGDIVWAGGQCYPIEVTNVETN